MPLPPGPLPPTPFEIAGTLLGFLGVIVLVLLRGPDAPPSLDPSEPPSLIRAHSSTGDLAELFAAATIACYLAIGRSMRRWMPLWAYVFPVTAVAALATAVGAVGIEGADLLGVAPTSLLGWASSPRLFGLAMGAAILPGIFGHTLANLSLSYVHPLILTTTQLLQPLISGAYGYAVGVQGMPAPATLAACPIILAGIAFTVTGSRASPLYDSVQRAMARGREGGCWRRGGRGGEAAGGGVASSGNGGGGGVGSSSSSSGGSSSVVSAGMAGWTARWGASSWGKMVEEEGGEGVSTDAAPTSSAVAVTVADGHGDGGACHRDLPASVEMPASTIA